MPATDEDRPFPRAIGNPATDAPAHAGIADLDQLATYTEAEVLALHGVGPKAIGILRATLAERGLSFADPA